MKKLLLILAVVSISCSSPETPGTATQADSAEVTAWRARAQNVTIIRDDWGIPHVYGKTDADVVFGVMYAQAEDDFNRVETNYLNSMGRLAEAEGEAEIFRDLRMKLFIDPADMQAKYDSSPEWLKALMNAHADGLNYYLHTHPDVKPRVITRFEPWMPLTFSEGSIGGDIERVNLAQLEAFYGKSFLTTSNEEEEDAMPAEPTGSNGFAIAPANSASGKALLFINPHTSFFFRAEAQMVSEEGLNAYGAMTWGQFFIYQGFNERTGWMHTSSGVDNIDEYFETIVKKGDQVFYKYGSEERPVTTTVIKIPYKTEKGLVERNFTVYRTHHGPVVRESDGAWISVRLMQEPVKALTQSYSRTKTKNYAEYKEVMNLHTNSSNNTVFADAEGNIAYLHANFIPKRDTRFDWTKPVDGSDPATEWGPVMTVDESPNVLNPPTGWIQNTNNWPYSAAGPHSPKEKDYPTYVDRNGENPRGIHAIRVFDKKKGFTLDSLRDAAFDSYLPEFAVLMPKLFRAHEQTRSSNALKAKVADQIAVLRKWDHRWAADSVATSLAVFWGEELWQRSTAPARKADVTVYQYMESHATPQEMLDALATASDKLAADFGSWKTPWGEINRFQRLTADIVHPFNDNAPSIPVPFTSSRWGSLAAFGARSYNNSKKIYGTSGNSFVAAVEFGERVRAKAVTAGGQSGDPKSPNFSNQATRYASGDLRDVYFYRNQLDGHITRQYRPGE